MKEWAPHVTVAAIIERDGRFLLVEESDAHGRHVLNQPAGHLEPGESLCEAVVRETFEETAWRITPQALTGIYRWVHPDNGETFLRVCFAAQAQSHVAGQALDNDILRTLWLDHAAILAATPRLRSPLVLRSLDDYRAGLRYPLALLQELP